MNKNEIQFSLLARNTILNFIGQVAPLAIGVIALPFIIHGLGTDAFGILTLAWAVVGYFSLFDLGLGRATTKYVAEYLGQKKQNELPNVIWISLGLHLFLGLCGGALLAILTPLLIGKLLNIPHALAMDAKYVFLLMAITIPLVIFASVLRGTLEAAQRFDLINSVRAPAHALNFIIPVVILHLGFHLPEIVLLLVLVKLGVAVTYLILCLHVFPVLRKNFVLDRQMIRPLLTFGGWATVSNVVGPIMVYSDRFLIGSFFSMSAVTYYTAPYEIVSRLWILPFSLIPTLFPAFSFYGKSSSKKYLENLYARSVKYLLLVMGPAVLFLVLFAKDIIHLWLGMEFVEKSTFVFQILAIGVLINSLAHIPFVLIQGLGRPDIPAKFHLLELPLYIGLVWFMVSNFGIKGAALAWTMRVMLDTFLLFGASWKYFHFPFHIFTQSGLLRVIFSLFALAGTLSTISFLCRSILTKIIIVALLLLVFVFVIWRYLLNSTERKSLTPIINKITQIIKFAK